jgi:hypothetical protein
MPLGRGLMAVDAWLEMSDIEGEAYLIRVRDRVAKMLSDRPRAVNLMPNAKLVAAGKEYPIWIRGLAPIDFGNTLTVTIHGPLPEELVI